MTLARLPDKWERMTDESTKAYLAFNTYLQLGPDRSVDAAYRLAMNEPAGSSKRASGRWTKWANTYGWVARAAAWDEFVAAEARRGLLKTAEENQIHRVRQLTNTMNLGMAILGKADINSLSPNDARKLLPTALRAIEMASESLREEFGVDARPTTNRELSVHADLGAKGDEALDQESLLALIVRDELGAGANPSEFRVNGAGKVVPIEGGS